MAVVSRQLDRQPPKKKNNLNDEMQRSNKHVNKQVQQEPKQQYHQMYNTTMEAQKHVVQGKCLQYKKGKN